MDHEAFWKVAAAIREKQRFNLNYVVQDLSMTHHDFGYIPESRDVTPIGTFMEEGLGENCNTVACIAGETLLTFVPQLPRMELKDDNWERLAMEHLGINRLQARRLFNAWNDSIWVEVAKEYGWATDIEGLQDWGEVTADQAATVMERLSVGELEL